MYLAEIAVYGTTLPDNQLQALAKEELGHYGIAPIH